MKKDIRVILFAAAFVASTLACSNLQNLTGENVIGEIVGSAPTATAIPTTAPPVVPTEDLTIIEATPEKIFGDPGTKFFDDFSDRASGGSVQYAESWILDYFQGGYRISINSTETVAWTFLNVEYDDVRMVVDTRLIGGENDNFFGVICRYQDVDNFYTAVISSAGEFAILERLEGGGLEIVSGDQFTHSVAIFPDMSLNLLEVSCLGSQITLTVNGVLLAEAAQDSLLTGDVGLIVGTFTSDSSDVLFDNFTLFFEE